MEKFISLVLVLFTASCAADVVSVGEVEAELQPAVPYTRINSNGGTPLCQVQNNQCVPTSLRGVRAHRMLRNWVMTMHPRGQWVCPSGGLHCEYSDGKRAYIHSCTTSGDLVCIFGTTDWMWEGQVAIDAAGQGAVFYFFDGGHGQANPAGPVFWYSAP